MSADGQIQAVLRPGDLVDHFKVVRLVGRGGMGEVYLARDTKLGRKVALKVVKPEDLGDEDAVERFLFEAKVTARFAHPHIVTIHAVGEHRGRPYVALEFLEGQTLRERLKEQRPAVRETLRIGLAIAEALKEAHDHKILHRDLKPENVLLPRDGRVRVVDFGLAKTVFGSESTETTQHGMSLGSRTRFAQQFQTDGVGLAGTPAYMAPEQWREEECTAATDVWALGLILYELLSGKRPYEGSDAIFILASQVIDEAPVPALRAEGVPPQLVELVTRCVLKDPAERPATQEVVEALHALVFRGRGKLEGEESPFRGLLPFTERHAELFFGREGEVGAFVERLRDEAVLPVVGPSGAGKSSFVQAGVIPRLREQGRWVVLGLRPGSRPFEALASRLVRGESGGSRTSTPTKTSSGRFSDADGSEVGQGELHRRMQETPGRLGLFLAQVAEEQQSRVLLFVDQLEELYTLVADEEERRCFMEALCLAADDPEGPVRVVFTARDDFLGKLAESAAAREALSRVTVLRAPGPEAMQEILTQPLEYVGYSYEDEKLASEMVAAVRGESAGLPLLQFACSQLWERRDKTEKRLTWKAYAAIGGVEGALAHHADGVLEGLSAADVRLAREIFLRLVTSEGTRRTIARGELLQGLASGATDLLDRLIQSRTITLRKARKGDTDDAELELAHESLIRGWGRLRRWIEEAREDLAFLDEVGKAAELWDKRGRRSDEAWTGDALHDALRKAERMESVPALVGDFLKAGEELVGRRARRRRALVAVTIIALAIIAVALGFLYKDAEHQKDHADKQRALVLEREKELKKRHSESLLDSAEDALESGRMLEARAKLRVALSESDNRKGRIQHQKLSLEPSIWKSPALDLRQVVWTRDNKGLLVIDNGELAILDARTGTPTLLESTPGNVNKQYAANFDSDGSRVAIRMSTEVAVYDRPHGKKLASLPSKRNAATIPAVFSPDGTLVAVPDVEAEIRLWNVAHDRVQKKLTTRDRYVAFHADGKLLASGGDERIIRLWDIASAGLVRELGGHTDAVTSLDFSPDGKVLASASIDGSVRLWNVSSGAKLHELRCGTTAVEALDFHPARPLLIAGGGPGAACLWNTDSGELVSELPVAVPEPLRQARFSPDGQLIALAGGSFVELLDLAAAEKSKPRRHFAHTQIRSVAISPDGTLGVTSDFVHGEIAVRRVADRVIRHVLVGHQGPVNSLSIDPSGRLLASGGDDGTLRVWDLDTGEQLRIMRGHNAWVMDVTFDASGELLASVGGNSARVWEWSSGKQLMVVEHPKPVRGVAFHPHGREIATACRDGVARRWSTTSGKLIGATPEQQIYLVDIAYGPRGDLIAFNDFYRAHYLWNIRTGDLQQLVPGEEGATFGLSGTLWFHPTKPLLAGIQKPSSCILWDLVSGEEVERNPTGFCTGLQSSADAAVFAVTSGSEVTFVDGKSEVPLSETKAVLSKPPRVLTRVGWFDPASGARLDLPAQTKWQAALEQELSGAQVTADGKLLCALDKERQLVLWDVQRDAKVDLDDPSGPAHGVMVSKDRCLVFGAQKIAIYLRNGRSIPLVGQDRILDIMGAVPLDEHFAYVENSLRRVTVVDPDGRPELELNFAELMFPLGWYKGNLVLGTFDGRIDVVDPADPQGKHLLSMQSNETSPVVFMKQINDELLVFGRNTGLVEIWDTSIPEVLDAQKLDGYPWARFVENDRLFVVSTHGDSLTIDLTHFTRDYCDLLREVWDEVPVIWENGKAVVADPPKDHPCNVTTP